MFCGEIGTLTPVFALSVYSVRLVDQQNMFCVRDRHFGTCLRTAYLQSVSRRSAEHVSRVRSTLVTSSHFLTAVCIWSISRACLVSEIDTLAPAFTLLIYSLRLVNQ